MHTIQKLEILRDSIKNYKKFLHKKLAQDAIEEIGDWIQNHFINLTSNSHRLDQIRKVAFQQAVKGVFAELIMEQDLNKATSFIEQFTQFQSHMLLAVGADMFLHAIEHKKEDIKRNISFCNNYKKNILNISDLLVSAKDALNNTIIQDKLAKSLERINVTMNEMTVSEDKINETEEKQSIQYDFNAAYSNVSEHANVINEFYKQHSADLSARPAAENKFLYGLILHHHLYPRFESALDMFKDLLSSTEFDPSNALQQFPTDHLLSEEVLRVCLTGEWNIE